MEQLHTSGITFIQQIQKDYQNQSELMLFLSHVGDPRYAFLVYFPLSYCLHGPTGKAVIWLCCISDWLNGVIKWLLHGERPYWWVHEQNLHQTSPDLHQYRLTCETGPGSPSGHAMVTAAVLYVMIFGIINHTKCSQNIRAVISVVLWLGFSLVMMAVCMSRCYIATHFPHQVIAGVFTGILLSYVCLKIPTEVLKVKHHIMAGVFILVSSFGTYLILSQLGIDPLWSVKLAQKWCEESHWVHLDTTIFNGIMRDFACLVGFGIGEVLAFNLNLKDNGTKIGWFRVLSSVVVTLSLSMWSELYLKTPQKLPGLFYFVTFGKFLTLGGVVVILVRWIQNPPKIKNNDSKIS